MNAVLLLLAACAFDSDGPAPGPDANSPVPGTEAATTSVTAQETELLREELDESRRQLEAVDDRLSRIELLVAEMQEVGIGQADHVRYDPSESELGGRSVQAALDELAGEIDELQAQEGVAEPSDSLFQMHRDDGPMGGARLAPRTGQQAGQGRQGGPQQGARQGGPGGPGGQGKGKGESIGPSDKQQPP